MTQPLENKEKLLKTAIDLFAAKGFKGTSIRDIAQAMGMSISNIYHYFGSKEGLMLATLENSSKELVEKLREVSELDRPPLERFKLLLETHIHLSGARINEAKTFFLDEEDLSPEGMEINRRIQREILDIYIRELKTLEDLGYITSRNLTVTAFNIFGVINWHLRWYRADGSLSLDEIHQEMASFILRGIFNTQLFR
jgi:AcrR family transcriptional regulator